MIGDTDTVWGPCHAGRTESVVCMEKYVKRGGIWGLVFVPVKPLATLAYQLNIRTEVLSIEDPHCLRNRRYGLEQSRVILGNRG